MGVSVLLAAVRQALHRFSCPLALASHLRLLIDTHATVGNVVRGAFDTAISAAYVVSEMQALEAAGFETVWQGEGGARNPYRPEAPGGGHAAGKICRATGERQANRDCSITRRTRGSGPYAAVAAAELVASEQTASATHIWVGVSEGDPAAAKVFEQDMRQGGAFCDFTPTTSADKVLTEHPRTATFPPFRHSLDPAPLRPTTIDADDATSLVERGSSDAVAICPAASAALAIPVKTVKLAAVPPPDSTASPTIAAPPSPTREQWSKASKLPPVTDEAVLSIAATATSTDVPPLEWPTTEDERYDLLLVSGPEGDDGDEESVPQPAPGPPRRDLILELPPYAWLIRPPIEVKDEDFVFEACRVGDVLEAAIKENVDRTLRLYERLERARLLYDAGEAAAPEGEEESEGSANGVVVKGLKHHRVLRRVAEWWSAKQLKAALAEGKADGTLLRSILIASALRDDHSPLLPLPPGSNSPIGRDTTVALAFLCRNSLDRIYDVLTAIGYRFLDDRLGFVRAVFLRLVRLGMLEDYSAATSTYDVLICPLPAAHDLLITLFSHPLLAPHFPDPPATLQDVTKGHLSRMAIATGLLPPAGTHSLDTAFPLGSSLPGSPCGVSGNVRQWTREQRDVRVDRELLLQVRRLGGSAPAMQYWRRHLTNERKAQAQGIREAEEAVEKQEEELEEGIEKAESYTYAAAAEGHPPNHMAHPMPEEKRRWRLMGEIVQTIVKTQAFTSRFPAPPTVEIIRIEKPTLEEPPRIRINEATLVLRGGVTFMGGYRSPSNDEMEEFLEKCKVDPEILVDAFPEAGISRKMLAVYGFSTELAYLVMRIGVYSNVPCLTVPQERAADLVFDRDAFHQSIFSRNPFALERLLLDTAERLRTGTTSADWWFFAMKACPAGATLPTAEDLERAIPDEFKGKKRSETKQRTRDYVKRVLGYQFPKGSSK